MRGLRRFITLLSRELSQSFRRPLAYTVLFFFVLLTGFNFHAGVSMLNGGPTQTTVVEAFFNTVYFWFPLLLVIPLITMRLFSEEYKMGTIEPLMTAPVHDIEVVMAKYVGALVFFCALWLPSLLYFVVFHLITGATAAQAVGAYLGAYAILALIGSFYVAIGCLASALTSNQIVAAIMALAAIALMFFLGLLTLLTLNVSSGFREVTFYLSALEHMREFSRGVFDTRPIVFYSSMTALALFATFHVFQYRRWRS